jgi:probable HAF family extracellular repeat protein
VYRLAISSSLVLIAWSGGAFAQKFTATYLTPIGGAGLTSQALAINNVGQVAGESFISASEYHATLWNGTTPTDLGAGPLGGFSWGEGINSSGQVAGYSLTPDNKQLHATVWNGTSATDLGTLGGQDSIAFGINDAGQAAGWAELPYGGSPIVHATLWSGTTATDLGQGTAAGINNVSQVIGQTTNQATIWNGTTPTVLESLGGDESAAWAINDAGQVVGSSQTTGNASVHATLWNGTTPTDLGVLNIKNASSVAFAINSAGIVVGQTSTKQNLAIATLWIGGKVKDLNGLLTASLPGGEKLQIANGINDNGWIVAHGSLGNSYLLQPLSLTLACPEKRGKTGVAYNSSLRAAGGYPPYTFSITGNLPGGLTLATSTGAITGTPTAGGVFDFTGKVVDSTGTLSGTTTSSCTITINPQLSVTPNTRSFGNVPVNTSSESQPVTVTNIGNTSVPITSITPKSTVIHPFSQTNNCGTSIAAGASCTINVVFSPTTVASKTNTLMVVAGDGDGTFTVTLAGTGELSADEAR